MPKVVFSQLNLGRLPITPPLVWTLFLIAKKGAGNSNHGMDPHMVLKATMSEHYCMCAASRGDRFRVAPSEEGWDANNILPACLGLPTHDCAPCEMHMAFAHCSCMNRPLLHVRGIAGRQLQNGASRGRAGCEHNILPARLGLPAHDCIWHKVLLRNPVILCIVLLLQHPYEADHILLHMHRRFEACSAFILTPWF